jgi:hypothetical protein
MSASTGAAGRGSSSVRRLVARAQRPAVRTREDVLGFHLTEVTEAVRAPGAVTAPPPQGPFTAGPPVVPTHAVAPAPGRAAAPPQEQARLGAPPIVPRQPLPVEARRPGTDRITALLEGEARLEAGPLSRRSDVARAIPTSEVDPGVTPGWQVLAEPEPEPDRRLPGLVAPGLADVVPTQAVATELRNPAPTAPAASPRTHVASTPSRGAERPVEPPAAARLVAASPTGRPPAGDPPVPPPASAPHVRIERIEVITPPAQAAAVDPFTSLAPRRTAASRHRGVS